MPDFKLSVIPDFPVSKTFIFQKDKKPRLKYWYRTEIDVCVLCGKETKYRTRVYQIKDAGTFWNETRCEKHFI